MATPRKQSVIDVDGLTVDEILEMDVNSLGTADLRKVATRLMSAANKRLKRLGATEAGRTSPAYQAAMKRDGKFSVKGKNLQQLKQEFANMRNFMNQSTSSLSGWRKVKRKKKEILEKRLGKPISKSTEKKFWDVYNRVAETDSGKVATALKLSSQLQAAVQEQIEEGKSEEDILGGINQTMEDIYESRQEDFDQSGDAFSFDPNFEE